jgi:uncharacterized cupin superfamily protein
MPEVNVAIVISQPADLPKEALELLGPVEIPLSESVSMLVGRKFLNAAPGIVCMGVWECSPGRWRRTIMQEEFAHFIKGGARFIPDDGEPIDLRAGDTIWFPENSRGIWEVTEDVRKVYVVIDRPGMFKRIKQWVKRTAVQRYQSYSARGTMPRKRTSSSRLLSE